MNRVIRTICEANITAGPQLYAHARGLLSFLFGAECCRRAVKINSHASADVTGPIVPIVM